MGSTVLLRLDLPHSRQLQNPRFAAKRSGWADSNRRSHRPEMWPNSSPQTKACKSRSWRSSPPPLRSSNFSVDSRGFRQRDPVAPQSMAHQDSPARLLPAFACLCTPTKTASGHTCGATRASRRAPAAWSTSAKRRQVAPPAVPIRIALALARLRVGAVATAHPEVTRLDRPRRLPGDVVEVGLAVAGERSMRSATARSRGASASQKCRASATARRRSTTRSHAAASGPKDILRVSLGPAPSPSDGRSTIRTRYPRKNWKTVGSPPGGS